MDKYKQKIQAHQDLQKENSELREELSEVRELYQAAEKVRQQVPELQRNVEDYRRVLEKVEQEHYELQQMKRQLEFDNKALAKRWNETTDEQTRKQQIISDLSDKLRSLDGSSMPPTPALQGNDDLGIDTNEHGDSEQWLHARLAEHRKENQRLRSAQSQLEGELGHVRQMLNDVREGHAAREKSHRATHEELLTLRSSLEHVQQGQNLRE